MSAFQVGDTWVYGNPSDPLKMAQYRGLQRAWIRCMAHEPRCALSDAAIQMPGGMAGHVRVGVASLRELSGYTCQSSRRHEDLEVLF